MHVKYIFESMYIYKLKFYLNIKRTKNNGKSTKNKLG